jgi:hypothetical protein
LAFLKESKPWTFHKRFFQRAAIAWGGCELIQTKKGVKSTDKIKTGKMTLRQDRTGASSIRTPKYYNVSLIVAES